MESAAGYLDLPGRNLDQHDSGLLQCAFVHAVGGVGGFALPSMCLSYRLGPQHCISPANTITSMW